MSDSQQKCSKNVDLYSLHCSDPQFLQELRSEHQFVEDSKFYFRKNCLQLSFNRIQSNLQKRKELTEIFIELNCAVKIIVSFGFVLLEPVETQDYRHFFSADNNPLFQLSYTGK